MFFLENGQVRLGSLANATTISPPAYTQEGLRVRKANTKISLTTPTRERQVNASGAVLRIANARE